MRVRKGCIELVMSGMKDVVLSSNVITSLVETTNLSHSML